MDLKISFDTLPPGGVEMARTTGTESLAELLQRGALKSEEPLVIRRRSKPEIVANLTTAGTIRMAAIEYATPSAAARAVLDGRASDGWVRWRVPRLDYLTLAELRDGHV